MQVHASVLGLALCQAEDLVCRYVAVYLGQAWRPTNFDDVGLGRCSQTEMQPQIVLGIEARLTQDMRLAGRHADVSPARKTSDLLG